VTVDPDLGLEVAGDGQGARQILAHGAGANADVTITPIWSPDGRDLAVATENSNGDYSDGLYIVRADGSGGRELLADGLEASANAMAWSPDGDELAIWAERAPAEEWGVSTLEVLDLGDHAVKKLATVPAARIPEGVYWAADGRLVVLLVDNNAGDGGSSCGCEIRQIPATGGRLRPLAHPTSAKEGLWQLSPDGRTIVVQTASGGRQYLGLNGSVVAGPARAPQGWVDWVAGAPSPESSFDRGWTTRPSRGTTTPTTAPTATSPPPHFGAAGIIEVEYASPQSSPDVSEFYAEPPGGGGRRLIFTTPQGILEGEALDGSDFFGGVALSPGGGMVAELGPATSALDVGAPRQPLHQVWPQHGNGTAQGYGGLPVWSPDGRDLAVETAGWNNGNSYADGLDIVRADGGKVERVLAGGLVDGPVWSSDGDELAVWTAERPGNDDEPSTLEIVNLLAGSVKRLATIKSYLVPEGLYWEPGGKLIVNIYDSNEPSTGGVVVDQIPVAGGRLAPWAPWPSLVAEGVSAAGAAWSPDGAEIVVDKGGSLVVLSATRLLSSVRAPNDSVLEWASSHPSAESTFDRNWH
jgi:hypothetical protein